jgi:hypothetical protein
MSATPTTPPAPDAQPVELSLAEEWVIHSVMLDQLTGDDAEDDQPWWALGIASKLESGVKLLSPFEAWRLRRDLEEYAAAEDTPSEDATLARDVVERIDERFDPPPETIVDE